MINVSVEEFARKWYLLKEDLYTNGTINGIIVYEDDKYIVIKIKRG